MAKKSTLKPKKVRKRVTCKVRGCQKVEESGGLCEEHRKEHNPYAGCLILPPENKKALLAHINKMINWIADSEAYGHDLGALIRKCARVNCLSEHEWLTVLEAERFFEGLYDDLDSYWEQVMADLGIERQ